MTQSEVINKLSMEMAIALGDLDTLHTCRHYLSMALSIGIEHFTVTMEEIVAMDFEGVERGHYKSVTDAGEKLGLYAENITAVLNGRQHSAGGFLFIRARDKELVPAKKTA